MCKTQKPSSRFSKTQFGKFCRNPVILQKPSSENDKTQIFRNLPEILAFFLNTSGICQVFCFFRHMNEPNSLKFEVLFAQIYVHEQVFVLLDRFLKPNLANFTKTQLFSKNSVLKIQKPSSENAKTQFFRNSKSVKNHKLCKKKPGITSKTGAKHKLVYYYN